MKTTVLLYNTCCIYEIVILNYFLNFTGKEVEFVSMDGTAITAMEGYSINISKKLSDINIDEVELFVIPGGNIAEINNEDIRKCLHKINANKGLIAAICAGVDVLDDAGLLKGIKSTHSSDPDVVVCDNIITSRANGYVDFAIETAKAMNLFESEEDLRETIEFWREHKRMM